MNEGLSVGGRVALNKALQLLDSFRDLHSDMPMGEAVSFLLIAAGETRDGAGLTVKELGEKGGFGNSSASRYMKSLAKENRHGNPGHELISDSRDPMDDRKKILRLTAKGNRLVNRIINIVG